MEAALNSQRVGIEVLGAHAGRLNFMDRIGGFLQLGRCIQDRNRDNEYVAVIGIGFEFDP